MSLAPRDGKLWKKAFGGRQSQVGCVFWGNDPVKEIGQTCESNVIVRRKATSSRSVVTAPRRPADSISRRAAPPGTRYKTVSSSYKR
jgi:hypothetical protein